MLTCAGFRSCSSTDSSMMGILSKLCGGEKNDEETEAHQATGALIVKQVNKEKKCDFKRRQGVFVEVEHANWL